MTVFIEFSQNEDWWIILNMSRNGDLENTYTITNRFICRFWHQLQSHELQLKIKNDAGDWMEGCLYNDSDEWAVVFISWLDTCLCWSGANHGAADGTH